MFPNKSQVPLYELTEFSGDDVVCRISTRICGSAARVRKAVVVGSLFILKLLLLLLLMLLVVTTVMVMVAFMMMRRWVRCCQWRNHHGIDGHICMSGGGIVGAGG